MTKVSMDKKYTTRSGLDAKILYVGLKDNSFPVSAMITLENGKQVVYGYTASGKYYQKPKHNDPLDLIEVVETVNKFRLSFYNDGAASCCSLLDPTAGLAYKRLSSAIRLEVLSDDSIKYDYIYKSAVNNNVYRLSPSKGYYNSKGDIVEILDRTIVQSDGNKRLIGVTTRADGRQFVSTFSFEGASDFGPNIILKPTLQKTRYAFVYKGAVDFYDTLENLENTTALAVLEIKFYSDNTTDIARFK